MWQSSISYYITPFLNKSLKNFRQPWWIEQIYFYRVFLLLGSNPSMPRILYLSFNNRDDMFHHDSPWCGPSVLGGVWSIWRQVQQHPPSGANLGRSTWKTLQPSPRQGWRNPPCTNNSHKINELISQSTYLLHTWMSWTLLSLEWQPVKWGFPYCGG